MSHLPPGPKSSLLTTLRYLRAPYASIVANARRYGEPHSVPSFLGKMVLTCDPAGARTLLLADPDLYEALGTELLKPVLGETNPILLSGERHRAMRKLQAPPFHGARMRVYGRLIQEVATAHAARFPRGQPFSVHEVMQSISLEVIFQAVIGLDDPKRRSRFRQAILSSIAALSPLFLFVPALRRPLLGLSPWARFLRIRQQLKELFDEELALRRAAPQPRDDILSLLMEARYEDGNRCSDDELLVQMLSLVAGGHETTAGALAWALYFIHRDLKVKQRLLDELRTLSEPLDPEAVARLPYLDAVCAETLRINPGAPLFGRTLRRSLTLQGYEVPAGYSVGVGVIVIHRRPDLYPEPERFRPERFLARSYTPFEYLPFGGGARRCLGAAFAMYEMKLVLAALLRQHTLQLLSSGPIPVAVRNTIVGPGAPIWMALA